MRVLWVTPSLPHPMGTGGCVHEFQLIRALAQRHEIEVLTSDPVGALSDGPLLEVGARLHRVGWEPRPYPLSSWRRAAALAVARPDLVTWLKRDRLALLEQRMRDIDARHPVDLVQITLGEIAPLVSALDRPTGLFLFDSLTRELERQLEAGPPPLRRAQRVLERRRMRRFERHWYRRADALAAVSSVDAAWVERYVGRTATIVENSIPDYFFAPPQRPRSRDLVTFVGTLNHPPNADAIEWLVTEIWPRILRGHSAARLRVVGRGDASGLVTARMRSLVEGADGQLFSDVDDVRPHYWESAVTLAPIRLGAGMRTKVIHALACGAPVVATETALEGLAPHLAVAATSVATACQLADAVVQVLVDPQASLSRVSTVQGELLHLRSDIVAERLEAWWASLLK